jgi:heat shock protein HslJ
MSRIPRPRAATLIAFVALIAALGGTAYAAKTMITSKNIVDGTIKGKDVKDDALKGAQVKENTLGKVPNAAQADSATSATTADSATTATSADDADTVGGKSPDDLDTRWALVNEEGEIEAQTGGFTVVDCYTTNANCYIDIGEDATNNGISGSIAINNVDGSSTLSGQIGVGACGLTSIACAPPNTDLPNVIVAAPRDSAGAIPGGGPVPAAADASRFYVEVTGSEAVAPAP